MRPLALGLITLAVAAVAPSASADVLVHAPKPSIRCGADIKLGVWYQAYSGGPRWAVLRVRSAGGRTLARRRVTATTRWRYWTYSPACGRSYRVRYDTPGGHVGFTVRVR